MAEGSPQTIIEQDEQVDLPPILMLLKANDRNHPLEMQERFIASYRKRGGAIEVHTFDGLPEHRMVPVAGPAGNDACHRHHHHIHSAPNWLGAIRPVRHDNRFC